MKVFLQLLFITSVFFINGFTKAHPVIYQNGWVYWGVFSSSSNSQRVSYTFHPRFSAEVSSQFYKDLKNYRDYKVGLNILVKRWIFNDSQANIYTSINGGYFTQHFDQGPVFQSRIEADWESRKLYTASTITAYFIDGKFFYPISYRIGFAPYVVGMDSLQTWLIFKLDYFKQLDNKIKFTPLLRFFYKNVLWEIGSEFSGHYFIKSYGTLLIITYSVMNFEINDFSHRLKYVLG